MGEDDPTASADPQIELSNVNELEQSNDALVIVCPELRMSREESTIGLDNIEKINTQSNVELDDINHYKSMEKEKIKRPVNEISIDELDDYIDINPDASYSNATFQNNDESLDDGLFK